MKHVDWSDLTGTMGAFLIGIAIYYGLGIVVAVGYGGLLLLALSVMLARRGL